MTLPSEMRERAAWLRRVYGEEKTPALLERGADEIERLMKELDK